MKKVSADSRFDGFPFEDKDPKCTKKCGQELNKFRNSDGILNNSSAWNEYYECICSCVNKTLYEKIRDRFFE
jgi:hypothetical protein